MTKIIKYWQRHKFWGKMRDTVSVFGTGTTIGLEVADINGLWSVITAIATISGTILGIWMSDEDGDGLVDIFQDHK